MSKYTIEVSEEELAMLYFVVGLANGSSDIPKSFEKAVEVFDGDEEIEKRNDIARQLSSEIGVEMVDYNSIKSRWEDFLGVGGRKQKEQEQEAAKRINGSVQLAEDRIDSLEADVVELRDTVETLKNHLQTVFKNI